MEELKGKALKLEEDAKKEFNEEMKDFQKNKLQRNRKGRRNIGSRLTRRFEKLLESIPKPTTILLLSSGMHFCHFCFSLLSTSFL